MIDVAVVGLSTDTVPLLDIGMDVPHGVVVRIPADKATQSKDLWRAINQRRVFRLQGMVTPAMPPPSSFFPEETALLRERITQLERENKELREALAKRPVETESKKLDEILGFLRQAQAGVGVGSMVPAPVVARVSAPVAPAVVEIETPSFIPSTLKMEPTESRVEIAEEASSGGGVSDARSALRKLRRNE